MLMRQPEPQVEAHSVLCNRRSRRTLIIEVPIWFADVWPSLWQLCALDDYLCEAYAVPLTARPLMPGFDEDRAKHDDAYLLRYRGLVKRLYRHIWMPVDKLGNRLHLRPNDMQLPLTSSTDVVPLSIILNVPEDVQAGHEMDLHEDGLLEFLKYAIECWASGPRPCKLYLSDYYTDGVRSLHKPEVCSDLTAEMDASEAVITQVGLNLRTPLDIGRMSKAMRMLKENVLRKAAQHPADQSSGHAGARPVARSTAELRSHPLAEYLTGTDHRSTDIETRLAEDAAPLCVGSGTDEHQAQAMPPTSGGAPSPSQSENSSAMPETCGKASGATPSLSPCKGPVLNAAERVEPQHGRARRGPLVRLRNLFRRRRSPA
jgi:hypothetical protein